jgi:hypothetical protein
MRVYPYKVCGKQTHKAGPSSCASRPVVEGVIAVTAASPVDFRKERRLLLMLRFDSLITFRLQSSRPYVSEEVLLDGSCWTDWIVFTRHDRRLTHG